MQAGTQPKRVVLDTDTYNEVDDQFALAHLMLSTGAVEVEAVYAAPFLNSRSTSAEDGMEKSYDEIFRVLGLLGRPPTGGVFKGSRRFMAAADEPVESPAALDLIERALAGDRPLVVCAIGAVTNVASALLIEPKIAERIEVVWLGGHAPYWPDTDEFNLRQDLHASRIVMSGIAPLVHIPCKGVASHMLTSVYELDALLAPFSELGAYFSKIVRGYTDNAEGWSKEIWDLAASAYVIDTSWFKVEQQPSPVLTDELKWTHDLNRPGITIVNSLDRDAIFRDFFCKARETGPLICRERPFS